MFTSVRRSISLSCCSLIPVLATLAVGLDSRSALAQPQPHIFRINASRQLTGFRIKGITGIVTALHGVADAKAITATSTDGGLVFAQLQIVRVNIERDLAILSSAKLQRLPPDGMVLTDNPHWEHLAGTEVTVSGYPVQLQKVISTPLRVRQLASRRLRDIVPPAIKPALLKRQSPSPDLIVLSLSGHLLPGHSGAPILDTSNRVVAVANGGLNGGKIGHGWAVPISTENWNLVADTQISSRLEIIRGADTQTLFRNTIDPSELTQFTNQMNRISKGIKRIEDHLTKQDQLLRRLIEKMDVVTFRIWDPSLADFLIAIDFKDGDDPSVASVAWRSHSKANLSRTKFAAASTVCDLENSAFVRHTLALGDSAILSIRKARTENSFPPRVVGAFATNEIATHILRLFFLEECVRFLDDEKSRTYEDKFRSVISEYLELARNENVRIPLQPDHARLVKMIEGGLKPQRRELAIKKGFTESQRTKLNAEYLKVIEATVELLKRSGAKLE